MNKALLFALALLTAAPVLTLDTAPASARVPFFRGVPSYRPSFRPRPFYRPIPRFRRGPIFIVPPPLAPPIVYVPPARHIYAPTAPAPVATAPAAAPAAETPRDLFGIGLHLMGASTSGEKVGISTAENPTMGGVGVHLRGRFSEDFGLELSADFLSGSASDRDLEQSTIPLMAGLTWHILPTSRLQPYLIAGLGVHFTRLSYLGGDYAIDISELAWQFGGGVEFFISENLALHADIRMQTVVKNLDTKEQIAQDCLKTAGSNQGFCDNIHFTSPDDKVNLGVSLSAGMSWYF